MSTELGPVGYVVMELAANPSCLDDTVRRTRGPWWDNHTVSVVDVVLNDHASEQRHISVRGRGPGARFDPEPLNRRHSATTAVHQAAHDPRLHPPHSGNRARYVTLVGPH